jgi:hypothetical protein
MPPKTKLPAGGRILRWFQHMRSLRGVSRDDPAERHASGEQQQATAHDQRDIEPSEGQQATRFRLAGLSGGSAAAMGSLSTRGRSTSAWRAARCDLTRDPAPLATVAGTRGLGKRRRREGKNSDNGG